MGELLRKMKAKFNAIKIHEDMRVPETEIIAGMEIDQDYELRESNLGKGSYGSVRECTHRKTGKKFACKTIPKSTKENDRDVFRERDILRYVSSTEEHHPGLVKYRDFYEDSKSFYIIMELCSGEQLRRRKITERKAASVMINLMSILRHLHAMGVAHRDVKHANIMISKTKTMKLVDFGMAIKIRERKNLSTFLGSLSYMAPEVMSNRKYSEKVDIWSAGVILYHLLSGSMPFKGNSETAITIAIKEKSLDFTDKCWKKISPEARDLVTRMLCRDVDSRLSAEQVLEHPWIARKSGFHLSSLFR